MSLPLEALIGKGRIIKHFNLITSLLGAEAAQAPQCRLECYPRQGNMQHLSWPGHSPGLLKTGLGVRFRLARCQHVSRWILPMVDPMRRPAILCSRTVMRDANCT